MAMETSNGLTVPHIMDNSQTTISMVRVYTYGQTSVSTRDNGRTIRCMALDSSHGLMDANIKVIIMMIRNRVTVCSPGQTVANTTVNGSTVNSTVKGLI